MIEIDEDDEVLVYVIHLHEKYIELLCDDIDEVDVIDEQVEIETHDEIAEEQIIFDVDDEVVERELHDELQADDVEKLLCLWLIDDQFYVVFLCDEIEHLDIVITEVVHIDDDIVIAFDRDDNDDDDEVVLRYLQHLESLELL